MIRAVAREDPIPKHLYRLFGLRTGIVNNLWDILPDPGSTHGIVLTPSVAQLGPLLGRNEYDPSLRAGGKGLTVREKTITCIGETVERYCSYWPAADPETASYDEMASRADVSVPEFDYLDVYDREEHPEYFAPLTRQTPLAWERGLDLVTGRSVTVPSGLVRMNTGIQREGVQFYGSSNGNATGPTLAAAAVGSLLELVERDAFMRTWCRQRSPPTVDLDPYPAVRDLVSEFVGGSDDEVEILHLDSPFDVPTVGAVRYSRDGTFPSFAVCAAAALDPAEAIRDAVLELVQSDPFQRQTRIDTDVEAIRIEEVMNLDDNFLYYAFPEHFEDVAFLLSGETGTELPSPPELSTPPERLDYLRREFDRVGATPVLLDITTADVREVGLRVTSGVAPELVSLSPPAALPAFHPVFEGETITDKPHPFP